VHSLGQVRLYVLLAAEESVELILMSPASANVYGDSEDLIGKWFERSGKRGDIFLATKFGYSIEGGCGKPEYVKQAAEKSLKRLKTESIDLYYLHRWGFPTSDAMQHIS
jgi:aryl-alcohol dehydrogenase-like predicted oxidoreductase